MFVVSLKGCKVTVFIIYTIPFLKHVYHREYPFFSIKLKLSFMSVSVQCIYTVSGTIQYDIINFGNEVHEKNLSFEYQILLCQTWGLCGISYEVDTY